TYSEVLNSVNDRRFVQLTVGNGAEANLSLTAGSDYDLYVFNSSHTIIQCATTHDSNSENIKLQFGGSQTENTVIVEIAAYGWTSGGSNFTLAINGEKPITGTQLTNEVQNKTLYTPGGRSSLASSPQCTDPGGSSTSSRLTNPIIIPFI